jgi:hypothetical protein
MQAVAERASQPPGPFVRHAPALRNAPAHAPGPAGGAVLTYHPRNAGLCFGQFAKPKGSDFDSVKLPF